MFTYSLQAPKGYSYTLSPKDHCHYRQERQHRVIFSSFNHGRQYFYMIFLKASQSPSGVHAT